MQLHQTAQNFAIEKLNSLKLPNAILVIPDGNGRWAKEMGLSVYEGHKKGAQSFAKIIENFLKINTKVLGAWGFSEDNWKRPQDEIDKIMDVIEGVISENLQKMIDNNIKFLCLGRKENIKEKYPKLLSVIENAIEKTSKNTHSTSVRHPFDKLRVKTQGKSSGQAGKIIALFVDYGERLELEEFAKAREKNPNKDTYELLSEINQGLPLFDMILRTSGELRLSGFGPLASIAEFVSVKKNLPDLTELDFANALIEYTKRQRRLGGRPS